MNDLSSHFSPEQASNALARLKAGNHRFLMGDTLVPSLEMNLLEQQAHRQQPYATILGCSDSRAPPELVFDAWLGELFVVRVAGNVLDESVLGTLQYAARHLHTPLYVVMGHEGCGAVQAAIAYRFNGTRQAQRIESLLERIAPALDGLDTHHCAASQMTAAVEANVRKTVKELAQSPEGKIQLARGAKLMGAVYELKTGQVRFLDINV